MGAYIGNKRDEAALIDRVYIGASDLATVVRKVYIGDENGEAVLVWELPDEDEPTP